MIFKILYLQTTDNLLALSTRERLTYVMISVLITLLTFFLIDLLLIFLLTSLKSTFLAIFTLMSFNLLSLILLPKKYLQVTYIHLVLTLFLLQTIFTTLEGYDLNSEGNTLMFFYQLFFLHFEITYVTKEGVWYLIALIGLFALFLNFVSCVISSTKITSFNMVFQFMGLILIILTSDFHLLISN